MTPERLREQLALLQQPGQLRDMAHRARARALPDAAAQVADHCIAATGWREAA
jgi:UDP-N-acetylglucosamine:LPS N-acetylglucosamine transferase